MVIQPLDRFSWFPRLLRHPIFPKQTPDSPAATGDSFVPSVTLLEERVRDDATIKALEAAGNQTPVRDKVNALSAESRQQLSSLLEKVKDPNSRASLVNLLDRGLLEAKPARGDDTVLEMLDRLANADNLAPQLRSESPPYVDQVIQAVADPGKISQRKANTCGGATIEYMLAKENPAEFVRIAGDLGSTGTTTLQGGQQVDIRNAHPYDLQYRRERNALDAVMQTGFMEAGRTLAESHYDNATDSGSLAPMLPGLNPLKMPEVLDQVLGGRREFVLAQPSSKGFFGIGAHDSPMYDRIERSLAEGRSVPVVTAFTGDKSGFNKLLESNPLLAPFIELLDTGNDAMKAHYLDVVGLDRQNRTVTLRNPWGDGEQGQDRGGDLFSNSELPQRQLGEGHAGTITMSFDEFERIARCLMPTA